MSKFFKEKSLIPGISKNTFLEFNQRAGLNKRLDSFFLKQKHIYRFNKIVNKKIVEKKLKEKMLDPKFKELPKGLGANIGNEQWQ
jgi:hypothetical protein